MSFGKEYFDVLMNPVTTQPSTIVPTSLTTTVKYPASTFAMDSTGYPAPPGIPVDPTGNPATPDYRASTTYAHPLGYPTTSGYQYPVSTATNIGYPAVGHPSKIPSIVHALPWKPVYSAAPRQVPTYNCEACSFYSGCGV